ncbi:MULTISPECIES: ribonuclease M5 [unclassified Enterococcus]|uniref:ribonuclease M5 n=1 Tax=unclassified Enterococcus TaxID=2608891 RepID=UPI001553836E|nr:MULTISPECIES: ribonuclease M5 [unclassified Enterococcus]MBS7576283.1 ribonuclease M5 [Enterococcus sp. MMGLQ5-2]MBS7583516.1 ribonuclease M5 [Enterococcus sp. MMGLQ5-1]NPD11378.1 ribonuclease M5 [Enterococcus sp. MMGLQ5-1]NPD36121.1 ribonuclease M5 [Enterococcus sp. MMGLQ5-2]
MDKIKIDEVVVVEGHDDTVRLKQFFDLNTIQTGGSGVSLATIEQIRRANALHGVIVFTDPDASGEQIRREITRQVPDVRHAFLTRAEATPRSKSKGKSLGIEHADFKALKSALAKVYTISKTNPTNFEVDQQLLNRLGLTLGADAKQRRIFLGDRMRIGYVNAKQLKKRLALFQITSAELESIMKDYEEKNK